MLLIQIFSHDLRPRIVVGHAQFDLSSLYIFGCRPHGGFLGSSNVTMVDDLLRCYVVLVEVTFFQLWWIWRRRLSSFS